MKKIYIKGYFQKNLGDDLFIRILVERYRNVKFEMYSNCDYSEVYNLDNLKIYSDKSIQVIKRKICNLIKKIIKNNKNTRLEDIIKYESVINIGGSIFMEKPKMDMQLYKNNLFNYDIPFYIIGANFGPYTTEEFLNIHKKDIFPKAQDICFREKYSYDLFNNLPNVRWASDIVFNLDVSNVKITNNKKVVISVINCKKDDKEIVNQNSYNKKINELINYFINKEYEVVLMSFSQKQGDEEVINDIVSLNENKEKISKYFYRGNIEETLNVLGDSQIVVGTRFHANILGLLLGKTVIPIAYSDKTINVLKDMNFKGKIFDIRDMENFDVNTLTDENLNYKHNVSYQIKDAQRHFEKLDKVLNKKD